jgi:polar amino acid transport system substrate-binding protein
MKYIRFVILSIFVAQMQLAAASDGSMCPEKPIRFAHYEFGLIYSSGYGGIDDDFQKELARRSGCRFKVSVKPRARIWYELEHGKLDMGGSGIQTERRDKFAWFFPYIVEDNVVIVGPKVPPDVNSFEQFMATPTLRFGSVRAYRYSPYYDHFTDKLIAVGRYSENVDSEGVYRMFEKQRIDVFITNPILYLFDIKKRHIPPAQRIEDWDPAGPTPSGLVLSKSTFTPDQARQWQALVEKMVDDGTVLRIAIKHLGPDQGPKTVYQYTAKTLKDLK